MCIRSRPDKVRMREKEESKDCMKKSKSQMIVPIYSFQQSHRSMTEYRRTCGSLIEKRGNTHRILVWDVSG
jgi:hypothetical protein